MKTSRVELRVTPLEKEAFEEAASLTGMTLATWMRVSLKQASVKVLEDFSRPIPFQSVKRD